MLYNYQLFLEEIKNKTLTVTLHDILSEIDGKYIDIRNEFGYTGDQFAIQEIYNDSNFSDIIDKKELEKGNLESTDDFETFADSNITYFFLHKKGNSNISDPKYIIIQQTGGKISAMKMKNGNFDFYNKLTIKIAEIKSGSTIYIYTTSNSGNNWELKNKEEIGEFKKIINREDMDKFINDKKIKIKFT